LWMINVRMRCIALYVPDVKATKVSGNISACFDGVLLGLIGVIISGVVTCETGTVTQRWGNRAAQSSSSRRSSAARSRGGPRLIFEGIMLEKKSLKLQFILHMPTHAGIARSISARYW
jgi:hypothetical protein